MKKTKKLFDYEMVSMDGTKKQYVCPLSFIEHIQCPAQVARDHKHAALLLDHTHLPTLTLEYKSELKLIGIRLKEEKPSREENEANGEPRLEDEALSPKKFAAPSDVLERARKSKLLSYSCVNQKGESTILEGYLLTGIDLGPDPLSPLFNGHPMRG